MIGKARMDEMTKGFNLLQHIFPIAAKEAP